MAAAATGHRAGAMPHAEAKVTGLPKYKIESHINSARLSVFATETVTGEMRPITAYALTDCMWKANPFRSNCCASSAEMEVAPASHAGRRR